MAALIYNGDLTVLSSKVVKHLARTSSGTEDIANRCCTTRGSIRMILVRLKRKQLVEHDGRRPRTWALKGQLPKPAAAPVVLLRVDPAYRPWRQNPAARHSTATAKYREPTFKRWSNEETAYLIELKENGYRNSDIAKEIGRSASAINGRSVYLRRNGVSVPLTKGGCRRGWKLKEQEAA